MYDDASIDLALDLIEDRTLVLDVGASFGLWTVPLARESGASKVVAFEPLPVNRSVLENNLTMNAVAGHVVVKGFALGRQASSVHIALEDGSGGNAKIPLDSTEGLNPMRMHVDMRRLDDIEMPPGRVAFIKVDIEGFELDALCGAERTIASDRPIILGEFSTTLLAARGYEPTEAVKVWCQSHGYRIFEIAERRSAIVSDQRSVHLLPLQGERSGWELLLMPDDDQERLRLLAKYLP